MNIFLLLPFFFSNVTRYYRRVKLFVTVKASPGTPAYKSQEEYYDQIIEYKKVGEVLSVFSV